MISNFSPVRFGSGNDMNMPGLAQNRRKLSNDEINNSRKVTGDIFKTGGLDDTTNEKREPVAINSSQKTQTVRNIIQRNLSRSRSDG